MECRRRSLYVVIQLSMDDVKFVSHQSPVWRERSNFLVMARLKGKSDDPPAYEQTWVRRQGEGKVS